MNDTEQATQTITLIRIGDIRRQTGLGRQTIYRQAKAGLLPTWIKIGTRASAWLKNEIDAVIKARAEGKSNDEIRDLVSKLMAERKQTQFSGV